CLTDEDGNNINLIHRDVSPSNILISWEGEIKLCDFGIAKVSFSRVKTRSGIVKGKVRYMSPEQARGWKLDSRTDIFSAGVVLYELLTGQAPFQAENEVELLKKVKDGHITPVHYYNKNIHPVLFQIVRKALTIDRLQRYQTAYDFARHLDNFIKKYAPNYSPKIFSKKIKSFFKTEIEEKNKNLQKYVLSEVEPQDVGVNLIGDNYEEPDNVEFYISLNNLPSKTDDTDTEDKNTQNNEYYKQSDKEDDQEELSDFLKRHLDLTDQNPQISKQNFKSKDTDKNNNSVDSSHPHKIYNHHLDQDKQHNTDRVRNHSNTENLSKEELAVLCDFPDKNLIDDNVEEFKKQDEVVDGDFIFKIKDPQSDFKSSESNSKTNLEHSLTERDKTDPAKPFPKDTQANTKHSPAERDNTDPAKSLPEKDEVTAEYSLTERDKTDPAKSLPKATQTSTNPKSSNKEDKTNPDLEFINQDNNNGITAESADSASDTTKETEDTQNTEYKDRDTDNIEQTENLSEEVEYISDADLVEENDKNKNFVTGVLDLSSYNKELAKSSPPRNNHLVQQNKSTKKTFSDDADEDEIVIEISKQKRESLNSSKMHSVSGCFSISPEDLKTDSPEDLKTEDEQDEKPD
ncbi:MAG: protein kinase, partial [Deltaproteobacteria bacterium]|nr:protein kinase [Deltaproteobacteria bacterium]